MFHKKTEAHKSLLILMTLLISLGIIESVAFVIDWVNSIIAV